MSYIQITSSPLDLSTASRQLAAVDSKRMPQERDPAWTMPIAVCP
jgi:hypothetical protein